MPVRANLAFAPTRSGIASTSGLSRDGASRVQQQSGAPAPVTPLADQVDLEVEQLDSLLTGHDVQRVLDWLRVLPDSSVLCTHDKVITRVTEILTRQGAELDGPVDFGKGAIWILERSAGRIERIHAVHPPVNNGLATTR